MVKIVKCQWGSQRDTIAIPYLISTRNPLYLLILITLVIRFRFAHKFKRIYLNMGQPCYTFQTCCAASPRSESSSISNETSVGIADCDVIRGQT